MGIKFIINPAEIQKLAPMPSAVGRLAKAVSDNDADLTEVVNIVEYDQALTANVLRWANSVWSGPTARVKTVREAILRLGTGNILQLAVGQGISAAMKNVAAQTEAGEESLWRHSVTAALAAECLGKFIRRPILQVSFTAALVHDIGKLLLRRHLQEETYRAIRLLMVKKHYSAFEAESEVLGTDHARVGGEIAWFWKFPDELVTAIEQHHAPDPAPEPILDAVQAANAIANFLGSQNAVEMTGAKIRTEVLQRLGLVPDSVRRICRQVRDRLEETLQLWEG
jgi:putative nucleotidyltransferase with HDIG domain